MYISTHAVVNPALALIADILELIALRTRKKAAMGVLSFCLSSVDKWFYPVAPRLRGRTPGPPLCPSFSSVFARKRFILPVSRLVESRPKQVIY